MRVAYSFSQIATYQRCPRQYDFACVRRLSRAIRHEESFGSSIHLALKRWGELEMMSAAPSATSQMSIFDNRVHGDRAAPLTLPTLHAFLRTSFIAEGYASRQQTDAALTRALDVMNSFFHWWATVPRSVVAIEEGFRCSLDRTGTSSVTLTGRWDRVERTQAGLWIIDYKTGVPCSQEHVDDDLQLSMYALAAEQKWQEPVAGLSLLFLSQDGVTERRTIRSPMQLCQAVERIGATSLQMESGHFPPTPSPRICARCPYRDRCDAAR